MWTTTFIRRHIFKLSAGVLFSTREFLSYGPRYAVDQALYRLVKNGYITRLARGIFIKLESNTPLPSPLEVATHKAKAFGKEIFTHALDTAQALGLVMQGNQAPTYATNGRSSSFKYGSTKIIFQGTSPRKVSLGNSPVGLIIRALWQLGQYGCTPKAISTVMSKVNRPERQQLRQSAHIMPAWLYQHFVIR